MWLGETKYVVEKLKKVVLFEILTESKIFLSIHENIDKIILVDI